MSFEPREYLRHILAEADYLIRESAGLTAEEFMTDETLQRAFVRSLEIIGEATKKIPDEFRARHPGIQWRAMAGMRDRLIHDLLGRGATPCSSAAAADLIPYRGVIHGSSDPQALLLLISRRACFSHATASSIATCTDRSSSVIHVRPDESSNSS